MATWATTVDVLQYTQMTVTDEALTVAGTTIDVACARPFAIDGARIGTRDLFWLKLACCYQAAWLTTQFDYFTRVDRYTDGHSSTLTTYPEGAWVTGPNTKAALKRVSWLKSRSLHVQSAYQDGGGVGALDPLSSANDGAFVWFPME